MTDTRVYTPENHSSCIRNHADDCTMFNPERLNLAADELDRLAAAVRLALQFHRSGSDAQMIVVLENTLEE